MVAKILMRFKGDDNEYPYGTYDFNTYEEKERVQQLAKKLSIMRECDVRIERIGEKGD